MVNRTSIDGEIQIGTGFRAFVSFRSKLEWPLFDARKWDDQLRPTIIYWTRSSGNKNFVLGLSGHEDRIIWTGILFFFWIFVKELCQTFARMVTT